MDVVMYITSYLTDSISVGLSYLSRIDEALRRSGGNRGPGLAHIGNIISCPLIIAPVVYLPCLSALFSYPGRLRALGSRSTIWWL